jgi:hypothetical protein
MTQILPVSYWGRKPVYLAKVGTGPSTLVLIKRVRKFKVGQYIYFCNRRDVEGMRVGTTPRWKSGHIYDIRGTMLFIELL